MSLLAIGGGAAAGGAMSLVGGLLGKGASDDAASAQEDALRRMEDRLNQASSAIAGISTDYIKELETLSANFNPYDMAKSYDSFYESVIVPLERDYSEYVVPSVHAAYSGGVTGVEGSMSGAAKEAEARSRRDLSSQKSQATAQERRDTIGRNFQMDARSRDIAKEKLTAATMAPMMDAGNASTLYQGETDLISTQLAGDQNFINSLMGIPGSMMQGGMLASLLGGGGSSGGGASPFGGYDAFSNTK